MHEMEHIDRFGRRAPAINSGMLPQAAYQEKEGSGRARILIVDASDESVASIRAALGDFEHDLVERKTTSEAVAVLSAERIDLVLVNLAAPELGGLEFCRVLKNAPAMRFLPVFLVGNSEEQEPEVRALEAGADEYLARPFRPLAFRARVQASLRHKAMIDSLDDSETVLFSLAQSVEERDPDLGQHCHRLALMGAAMGLSMGLPPGDILALQRGGYLHDIGKVAIPDNVLFKPSRLTNEEWDIMKTHAERGERICANMKSLHPVLPIIRNHHERWDGSGYPDGLKGEQIPLLARILQLADIYDALTTSRPYKAALTPEQAVAIIREEARKGWRDPNLVEMFAEVLPTFRTNSTTADFSRLSLHALAASIDRHRQDTGRTRRRSPQSREADPIFPLVSGF
jgi:putative two-component system response regulator